MMLRKLLNEMATKEQVIHALNLTQDQTEEFWETQFFTVKNRFYSYLLNMHRLPLTLAIEDVDTMTTIDLESTAGDCLRKGLNYERVRKWWKTQGTYLHNRAFDAKREQEKIDKMKIVVLVFLPKGRPLYLGYDVHGDTYLTDDESLAYDFPIMSISDISKTNLADAAKDFDSVIKFYNATHIKLLPKQRN